MSCKYMFAQVAGASSRQMCCPGTVSPCQLQWKSFPLAFGPRDTDCWAPKLREAICKKRSSFVINSALQCLATGTTIHVCEKIPVCFWMRESASAARRRVRKALSSRLVSEDFGLQEEHSYHSPRGRIDVSCGLEGVQPQLPYAAPYFCCSSLREHLHLPLVSEMQRMPWKWQQRRLVPSAPGQLLKIAKSIIMKVKNGMAPLSDMKSIELQCCALLSGCLEKAQLEECLVFCRSLPQ
ncbi:uncharacterized protein LOC111927618 [Cyanistes caeruleus]|uniref:uncharacterized protein LOC111927618 n=1 Tax=Cyanistes caeruleus TaxID=156563 RepID=UPI000CDA4EC0|nr:uncharacterized protein LOC111927618 [Cyanistes caeruleus]